MLFLYIPSEETTLDKVTFGLTVLIVGISGTFLTLAVIIGCTIIMKKIFPPEGNDSA